MRFLPPPPSRSGELGTRAPSPASEQRRAAEPEAPALSGEATPVSRGVRLPDGTPSLVRILLVEDQPADARLVREMLSEAVGLKFEVTHVRRLEEAMSRIATEVFDAVLLDLGLPDAQGLEAVETVSQKDAGLPIIVLSGQSSESLAVRAVRHGAQDYLVKGSGSAPILARAIRYAIERKHSEATISRLAYHDGLTSLPNRRLFHDRLVQELAHARRNGQRLAVMFLDVDNFKWINDSLGHAAGDLLLLGVAERLTACTRRSDTVARLSGDEFTLVLPEIARPSDVGRLADKVSEAFRAPFLIESHELFVSVSMGISVYPEDGEDVDTLMRNADAAMYRAKQGGRNNLRFYSPGMTTRSAERLAMGVALRYAMERRELMLHYQPLADLETGRTVGVEALLRWRRPGHGIVPPGEFIPIAEENGLMVPIGEWVLRNACAQAADWQAVGLPPCRLAVNISGPQLDQGELLPTVQHALRQSGWAPFLLDLELRENAMPNEDPAVLSVLNDVKGLGIRFAMDDFGTGYSSLGVLKRFPIDVLKIDRSFVKEIVVDRGDAAIVRATIEMAHGLDLTVVAEGVETQEQAALLREFGCDHAQGFYFCPPLPAVEMAARLYDEGRGRS